MKKSIAVTIHEPCHENWQQMNATPKGRFCDACSKEVVDFTTMTDDEVYRFFTNRTSSSNVCGRMLETQLAAPIAPPVEHKKKKFWYLAYLTSLLMLIKPGAKAQCGKPATEAVPPTPRPPVVGRIAILQPQPSPAPQVYQGKVTDESGAQVPFATIRIKGTKRGVSADENGHFSIKATSGNVLVADAVGYRSVETVLTSSAALTITLAQSERVFMGEMAVYTPVKKKSTPVPQVTLQTLVTDATTGEPVPFATIAVKGAAGNMQTDAAGSAKLLVQRNTEIKVSHIGYRDTIIVLEKLQDDLEIKLVSAYAVIEEVVVVAANPVMGHTKRMTMGGMSFVQSTGLAQRPNLLTKIADKLTGKNNISVSPNPVSSSQQLHIQFKGVDKGIYKLHLVSMAGALVQQAQIVVPDSKFAFQWGISSHIAAGAYQLSVANAAGKLLYQGRVMIL